MTTLSGIRRPSRSQIFPLSGPNQVKRKGQWGGRRVGAGRKPVPPDPTTISDPLAFLHAVASGRITPNKTQVMAAIGLLPYFHARKR